MSTEMVVADDEIGFESAEDRFDSFKDTYPVLWKYSAPLTEANREIVGRDYEISQLMAAMHRPELSNVILLAAAGTGKTALVQAAMVADTERVYLEVDLSRMIADLKNPDEMADRIKSLFDEAEQYGKAEKSQLVLFIDEFHQVIQLSPAAVEALKPVLAASGARGLRVIAATTFEEFHQYVAPNQPLMERLQRINVNPPDRATTVTILREMAERYGVGDEFYDDHMFELIYDYTNRYMPASSQPRKSIQVLDSMIGWRRSKGRAIDRALLSDVLMESTNINIAFRVDAVRIREQLDRKVISQRFATAAVAKRLQLCVADLNDPSRPMSSFLMTGSTGVGKSNTCSTLIPVWSEDGSVAWKRAGDLVPGDFTFTRRGTPQQVLGVFPQGEREVYRVTLGDGRTLDVSDNHLWAVYPNHQSRTEGPTIYSTKTLLAKGLLSKLNNGRQGMKYFIPMNEAVQWPEVELPVDPYVVGAMIGNGLMTSPTGMLISSDDEFTVEKVAERIGAVDYAQSTGSYDWCFYTGEFYNDERRKRVQLKDVYADLPEAVGVKSGQKRIPQQYLTASIEQRWDLVQGLFDTDGSIGQADGDRFNVSYSTVSEGLAADIQHLLYSLGVASTIGVNERERDGRILTEYIVRVKSRNADKARFFSLPRKAAIAERAVGVNKQREKTFDYVGIRSIEKLGHSEPMVCIYVDDDEHLYQAGDFVVTHNTELTKQLARLLFGDDQQHLIRFDMSEFSRDESLDLFRSELTKNVWNMGHSVLLFDEIEKASQLITRLMLQVLDDGRLTDDNGRQVSFLNTYIVMTTNAGKEIYDTIAQYNVDDEGSGKQLVGKMKEIRRSIEMTQGDDKFPSELLGRIDAIVPFQPLSRETQSKIVKNKLQQMRQEVMTKHGIKVKINPRVLSYLVDDMVDTGASAGGARDAISKMNDEVTTEVAAFINAHPNERTISVDVVGVMRNEDKRMLESDSYIEVSAER